MSRPIGNKMTINEQINCTEHDVDMSILRQCCNWHGLAGWLPGWDYASLNKINQIKFLIIARAAEAGMLAGIEFSYKIW